MTECQLRITKTVVQRKTRNNTEIVNRNYASFSLIKIFSPAIYDQTGQVIVEDVQGEHVQPQTSRPVDHDIPEGPTPSRAPWAINEGTIAQGTSKPPIVPGSLGAHPKHITTTGGVAPFHLTTTLVHRTSNPRHNATTAPPTHATTSTANGRSNPYRRCST